MLNIKRGTWMSENETPGPPSNVASYEKVLEGEENVHFMKVKEVKIKAWKTRLVGI